MIRWLPFLIALAGIAIAPGGSSARPTDQRNLPTFEMPDLSGKPPTPAGVFSLSSGSVLDTVWYGGTRWAPDSLRWEALKDSVWTFDTGIGSSINTGFNPNKPAGYHQTMEGWFGIDQTLGVLSPFFRRSSTCAIAGSYSAWLGLTQAEAESACFAAGQGYGNSFNSYLGKTFTYAGAGNVTLSYRYAVDSEPSFDYAYAIVDTTGAADPTQWYGITLATYTGLVSGTANVVLQRGVTMRSTPGPVTIWFNATADGSYSDEDGMYPTVCGLMAIDDIALSGALTDFTDFEAGMNGWSPFVPTTAIGDYSNLMHRNDLEAPMTFCACGIKDSVLVFYDNLTAMHPFDQDNIVVSPWIDLKAGGDVGRPGRIVAFDVYARLPLANYVFIQIRARWKPLFCPYEGSFRDQNVVFYFGDAPHCPPVGTPYMRDYSNVIDARAEQVQIALGVANLIYLCKWGPCDYFSNTTPYIDNVRFGVYGPATSPIVTLAAVDRFQDSFATDGTLNPGSSGRLDAANLKNVSPWTDNARLGDTLVARGNGGNTEVRIVFQVRPGPFTSSPALLSRAARWTTEPSIIPDAGAFGNTWYSARLDTAEQNSSTSLGNWMATFHESDPGFLASDRATDPANASELENEILPDHILTPGSRLDYFIQSRYIPPDPRNIGGANWFLTPDTTGRCFYESEVLPSSMAEDTTWNCVLYVDHHDDREVDQQKIEEQALAFALGSGGATAEGTRYDRYDVSAPLISLGRPFGSYAGASITQMFAYRAMAWMTGSAQATNILFKADANLLKPWLTISSGGNRFWASGDGFAQAITASNDATSIDFLQNTLGVTRTCNTIRDAACPVGTVLDSTYCLPLANAATPAFATSLPANVRGNGCPQLRSLDLLAANPSVTTARGQLDYVKHLIPASSASITNEIAGSGSKTVVDGFALGNLRRETGDLHNPSLCGNPQAALNRAADVLGWFGGSGVCSPLLVTGVGEDDDVTGAPPLRSSLSAARPNPSSGRTTIAFVNAVEGDRVQVQIFDITGRLVKSLLDAPMPAGHHEVIWDGSSERGSPAVAGLYFYRLTAGDYAAAKRLVLVK